MVSFPVKVKVFGSGPKTMDYSQAFWPKLRPFFVVLLLIAGRCYEAEIYAILVLLRCSFRWYHFFCLCQNFEMLEGVMKLKIVPFCSLPLSIKARDSLHFYSRRTQNTRYGKGRHTYMY